ncbi:MAG: sigma-70 family RNA polymerase sigma factor [Deltaproteobacteria bacterium]|nr:sigma-70 family RNA polymerase sigma factor [Deltaproteobacteria bacterium]
MVLYQKGEYRAFEELYARHSGRVYGYLKSRLSDGGEVDDLVQQVFFKLHQSRSRFNSSYPFLPWLFAIVRNLQIDFMRKRKAIPMDVEKLGLAVESQLHKSGEQILFDDSMRGLAPAERDLIKLRFEEGLSFDDISRRIGLTPSNARKRISRLMGRLRKGMRS